MLITLKNYQLYFITRLVGRSDFKFKLHKFIYADLTVYSFWRIQLSIAHKQ